MNKHHLMLLLLVLALLIVTALPALASGYAFNRPLHGARDLHMHWQKHRPAAQCARACPGDLELNRVSCTCVLPDAVR